MDKQNVELENGRRHFTEEDIQMTSKHMKSCLSLFVVMKCKLNS